MEESKGRVLWVDDEIDLLRSHVAFLRERGYHVETVTNGGARLPSCARTCTTWSSSMR